jgi:cellulose synthase/poly-beta-1,6-N-acetylglucosamine synthase-like glycosyltransferase
MTSAILVCLFLIFFAFVGYALLMAALARFFPRPWQACDPEPLTSGLSVVLCVHNAADQIQLRLQNLFCCDWSGPLEVIVFCDGCTDPTAELARSTGHANLRIVESPTQQGKAAGLNAAIPLCRYPVVVLCDVRQTFAPDAFQKLAAPFADPTVVAVSGLLDIAASDSGSGRGVDLYWRLETLLRQWEGQFDSVIGCTGAICAIRRDLYTPLPEDTLLDDVVIPMRLAVAGGRVLYEPTARAFDPQTLDPEREQRRKRRTLVGNFQMLERYPAWMLPWKNRLWCQLICHKYLRLLVPWLLIAVACLSALAPKTPLITLLITGQVVAYTCALAGCLLPHFRSRFLTVPAGFVWLQISCLTAFFAYLKHRKNYLALWQPPTPSRSA